MFIIITQLVCIYRTPAWCVPQTLRLVGCEMTAVPELVRHMSQLHVLDMSANQQLAHLDGGRYLEHLQELNLSRCQFDKSVPPLME